jgi:hypothetical protein
MYRCAAMAKLQGNPAPSGTDGLFEILFFGLLSHLESLLIVRPERPENS